MTETLLRPKDAINPKPKLWTREECHRLIERGELSERTELIEGIIYNKMGQNSPHRIALSLLGQWLVALFGYLNVQTEKPIDLSGIDNITNEPEPDAAVTREPTTAYVGRNPRPEDILLIVEVSDSSLWFDLNVKAALYARAGIVEFWAMDANKRQIHRHRQPNGERYEDIVVLSADETISAPGRSETIRIGELFTPILSA